MITLLALGVLAAVVLGSGIGSGGDSGKDAGPSFPKSSGPPPELDPVKAYRVTYLSDNRAGGEQIFTTETYAVRRPFDSVTLEYKGRPEHEIFVNERRQTFGMLGNEGTSRKPYAQVITATTPSADMRLDAVLDDLARRGAVVTGKAKTVDGRRCTIIKTKDPLFGAKPEPPNDQDHTDNCIDRHGIVLEERWWLSKKLTRIRTVVKLDLTPTFGPDDFDFKVAPLAVDKGGSLLQKIDALPEDTTTVVVPDGFELLGNYRYYLGRPPQGSSPQIPLVRTLQVWRKGIDFIALEQGQEGFGYGLPSSVGTVQIPTLVDTGINVSVSGPEVFGHDSFGQVWLLRGSITPERLLAVAKTIHK